VDADKSNGTVAVQGLQELIPAPDFALYPLRNVRYVLDSPAPTSSVIVLNREVGFEPTAGCSNGPLASSLPVLLESPFDHLWHSRSVFAVTGDGDAEFQFGFEP
jgi:hypothetical protein